MWGMLRVGILGLSELSTKLMLDYELSTRLERWKNLEKLVISSGTICREVPLPGPGPMWVSTQVAPVVLH